MRIIKRTLIILSLIICICDFTPYISTVNAGQIQNAINGAQNFASANTTTIINPEALYIFTNTIYGLVLGIAIVIAAIRGITIGMTIIMGTIEQKVNAKELIVPYLWIVAGIGLGGIVLRAVFKFLMSIV